MSTSTRSIFCRHCGAKGTHKHGKDARRRMRYKCLHCHKTFTGRTNTIRSGSQLTDTQWNGATRKFCTRAGQSAEDMAREMRLNRKTAQKLNRIFRILVKELEPQWLPGSSEWDEAIMSKQWLLGGVSRELKQCLIRPISNRTEDTLVPLVLRHSDAGGCVFTDEWSGYIDIPNHWTVCHSKEFVNRQAPFVHTNRQEGIWGHMKPLSKHIYRGFPKKSIPQFLSEFMFRYNIREYETRVSILTALLSRKTHTLLV